MTITITTILLLILIGLVLIMAEIFLIPGTTFVGFAGGVLVVTGIVLGFVQLDATKGWLIMAGTLAVCTLLGYLAFRSNTLDRFAVKSTIDSKIIDQVNNLETGMKGMTLTDCKPIGKAKFGEHVEEVYAIDDSIAVNRSVEIIHIKENKIFVQLIKS